MSDTNLEYERYDKELLEKCCDAMNVKAKAVKIVKARSLHARRKIEDLQELARIEKEFILD